ncbi:lipid II:glycine glycyltransferase FemX [Paenibacillus taiwanensis]|uniref:lipid II:glycine glycyltransferase FemX n=1 Tax=Paenibacillus taiwanensis TaxID=401638 RepID=UPI00041943B8|nr:GNAT family N-acetyltransferase [Paenibacillus taiwanensis]
MEAVVVLNLEQDKEWNELIRAIPEADIYFTADYCRIYEENREGKAQLFVYREGDDYICYPFLLRDASRQPGFTELHTGEPVYDITTPYGYGGPISNVNDAARRDALFRRFEQVFDDYCKAERIVTEFVRFHPLLNNAQYYQDCNPEYVRNTIYIDLTMDEQSIMRQYSRDNRNRIRRAEREGLVVKLTPLSELEDLLRLYYSTMCKKQANSYYYFKKDFFENTVSYLRENIKLLQVIRNDQVITSCLFMHYGDYAHYHLMGSDNEHLKCAPVNLLIHKAVMWAKSIGCKVLHLGGGYSGNDNLYRFKRSFNEHQAADFYVGKRIRNEELYNLSIQCLGIGLLQEKYFPIYRNPEVMNSIGKLVEQAAAFM